MAAREQPCKHQNSEEVDDSRVCLDCGRILENDLIFEARQKYKKRKCLIFYKVSDE